MIQVGDTLIASAIFEEAFVCDLTTCKGMCCVEGEEGAPLTLEEVHQLEEHIEAIKPYMTPEGIDQISKTGVAYTDSDHELLAALNDGKECSFVKKGKDGVYKCTIEQAHKEGKIPFNKPLSCHLYPIRLSHHRSFTGLNYDKWSICHSACTLGEALKIPVYQFLKAPIIRAFGEAFYSELQKIAAELQQLSHREEEGHG